MNDMTETVHLDAAPLALSQALRLSEIHPSPTNPRKTFPEAEQAELIANVKRHGVMTPILVRPWPEKYHTNDGWIPKYELVAGERRFRAAKAAGLELISGTVRDLDDHEVLELQIIENLHRKDLNELEEAEGYELMTKQYGYTAEQLAEKIDKSKAYIYARLKLTAACEVARKAFRDGTIDASRLLLIARIPTAGLQAQALEEITTNHWIHNYRDAADHVQRKYMLKLAEAPFPRADADLVPAAGKCHPCPKRTGNNPDLYPDVKSADICIDPDCYAAKIAAHFARTKETAKAQGQNVIDGEAAEKLLRNGDYNIKGFLKLDERCYDATYDKQKKSYPTYRELIADKALPITLIEKSDGSLIETVDTSAFKTIATDVGVEKTNSSNEDQKKREAAAKEETEVRRRIHAQIRTATQEDIAERGPALELDELRLVARQYFAQTWNENRKQLARLWIESEEKIADWERISRLSAMIDTMEPEQACLFLIDLALIGTTHCGPWDKTETPAPLLATASRLNVSVDTIRREVKSEQAKSKDGKKATKVATSAETAFKAGDPVQVKPDAVAEEGWALSARGRTGVIVGPDSDHGWYIVKLGDGEEALHQDSLIPTATGSSAAPQEQQPARKPTSKVEILYRHPDNADLEWSGRGRKPKWVEAWLADGGTLEQLAPPQRCDKTMELPGVTAPDSHPAIGTAMEGGFFGGIININGQHKGIIWAPKAEGEINVTLMPKGKTVADAGSAFDCLANTQALLAADSPAAEQISTLEINGFKDWLIPSKDVLELGYRHFKPTTWRNYCGGSNGENLNSLPPGAIYTKNLPAQTQLEAFKEGGAEAFDDDWYASSTILPTGKTAFGQDFLNGVQYDLSLSAECRVRAVRLIQL